MGRCTSYRNRIKFETGSVEAKSLKTIVIRDLRCDFGLSRLESEVLAEHSVHWLQDMMKGVLPGQTVIRVPATACMRYTHQKRKRVRITPIDLSLESALWREFGLAGVQRSRAVRIMKEIWRQDGWASLTEIAGFLNLTPNALAARIRPLKQAGVWIPHLGSDTPHDSQLLLEAFVVKSFLEEGSSESLRKLLSLTMAEFDAVLRRAVAVWHSHKEGNGLTKISKRVHVKEEEVESIIKVVQRQHRRKGWRDLERAYSRRAEVNREEEKSGEEPLNVCISEYGMSRIAARLFIGKLREIVEGLNKIDIKCQGETIFFAISADEGARVKLEEAKLIPVRLRYFIDEDLKLGPFSSHKTRVSDLKFARIVRYTTEAKAQGALLTLPDLAMLLGIHIDAIRRLIDAHPKIVVPTRGRVKDIGRGVTHRCTIVELYLQMHTETEIVERTGHSYESVEAYLKEFARVVTLVDRGLNNVMIRRVTGRSMSLVKAYRDLYTKYDKMGEYVFRLVQLKRIFAKDTGKEDDKCKKNSFSPTPGDGI
jgi:hypothetical protein